MGGQSARGGGAPRRAMTLEGYTEAIARKVVAQIMAQMEVEKARGSGLGCLADVLLRYVRARARSRRGRPAAGLP